MYRELYEKDTPSGESQIIAELIERAVILAAVELDLTMQYLITGLIAVVHLRPPHSATWNIVWPGVGHSNLIDTGMDSSPSLADPQLQEHLAEDIKKIHIHLHTFCRCSLCR